MRQCSAVRSRRRRAVRTKALGTVSPRTASVSSWALLMRPILARSPTDLTELMPMTSLVTGASGFLGGRTAAALCGRGEAVRVLVRPTSDRRRIADLPVEYAEGDVTDRASVEKALDGVETVYHAAALYELGTGKPEYMEQVNVGGTANVLEAAHERGILAVHVSSVAALGPTGDTPAVEGHWRQDMPRSPYEATKKKAHVVARDMAAGGARVRIAMPGTIYGPDDSSLL